MPPPHINDRMLKQMNRRHNRHETETLSRACVQPIPGLVLRTDHDRGLSGRDRGRVYPSWKSSSRRPLRATGRHSTYFVRSPTRPGPPSCPFHCPMKSKKKRKARWMNVQQPIAFAFNQTQVGRKLGLLIDAPCTRRQAPVARTDVRRCPMSMDHLGQRFALEIRPILSVTTIVGAHEHGLIAEPLSDHVPPNGARHRLSDPGAQPQLVAAHPRWHVGARISPGIAKLAVWSA